jgi:hypothetical protein
MADGDAIRELRQEKEEMEKQMVNFLFIFLILFLIFRGLPMQKCLPGRLSPTTKRPMNE